MDASREIQGNIHLCVNSIFNVSRILGTYQCEPVFFHTLSSMLLIAVCSCFVKQL